MNYFVGDKIQICVDSNTAEIGDKYAVKLKISGEYGFVDDARVIINQQKGSNEREVIVVPTTQDELDRTINNPFKGHGDRRVLSLTPSPYTAELISKYDIVKYVVRYLRRPSPIILSSLAGTGLTINGETSAKTCELHEALHRSILDRAVQIARGIWENTVQSQSRQ